MDIIIVKDIITAKEKEVDKENKENKANEAKWLDIDWSKLKWTLQNI